MGRFGRGVAESVASGDADQGIVFCSTGTGVSLAANKVHGARAALCTDAEQARGARRWNDANVLAMSFADSGPLADEILDAWFSTSSSSPPRSRTSTRSSGRRFTIARLCARSRIRRALPLAYRSRARSFFAVIAFLSRIATSTSSQRVVSWMRDQSPRREEPMASKNVQTALAVYENFNKRDLDGAVSGFAENLVFENHGFGQTYKSRAESAIRSRAGSTASRTEKSPSPGRPTPGTGSSSSSSGQAPTTGRWAPTRSLPGAS